MSYVNFSISYKKFNNLILIEKINLKKGNSYFFYPEDQLLCKHSPKFQKVVSFKKYLNNSKKTLDYPDYLKYIKSHSNFNFEFNNKPLMSEKEYDLYLIHNKKQIDEFFNRHHLSNCSICTNFSIRKSIRKRTKLTLQNISDISHDIGANYNDYKILKKYNISKTTLKNFKSNRNRLALIKKKRIKRETSLSADKINSILQLVQDQPFEFRNSLKIKRGLNLNCHPQTIRNVLKKRQFHLRNLKEKPYLNAINKRLKDKFCELVKDLDVETWKTVVFTDEKIVQSFNNSKYRIYRTKFKKGKRINKK